VRWPVCDGVVAFLTTRAHGGDVFFDVGARAPLCGGVGGLHGGGCSAAQSSVEDHLGAKRHVQDAASTTEGAMSFGFDFSLGGRVKPSSL
jgi:hypothetical protein